MRESVLVILRSNGVKYCVLKSHYEKYRSDYELVVNEEDEKNFVSDKEMRDKLREKGITFRGKKSRAEMECMLDELPEVERE